MKYDVKNDTTIMNDINILNSKLNFDTIFIAATQKNRRQRMGAEISNRISEILKTSFLKNKHLFSCIKDITINNKSPREPYEMMLKINLGGKESNIYVNLLPTNILKHSSPYIGSINKYIDRLKSDYIYDMIFLIEYKSEKNLEPRISKIKYVFVKDIDKISLYKNWQLQVNLQTFSITTNTKPKVYVGKLAQLLDHLGDEVAQQITSDCKTKKSELLSLKF